MEAGRAATETVGDLSFTVSIGGVVGFLDPNGAGKTTTFRAPNRRASGYSLGHA